MKIEVGTRVGKLVVISPAEPSKSGMPRWNCKCDLWNRAGSDRGGNWKS